MKPVLVLLVFCFLLKNNTAYSQRTDSIFLYNGQILVGTIKYAQLGVITIDDWDLKMVSVKLYKVKRMVAEKTNFKIQTNNKKIYYGNIIPSSKNGHIILLSDSTRREFDLTNISYMLELKKGFIHGLTGNVAAGFSFTKSSSIGQLNLSSNINYAQKRFEYQLSTSEIASIDSSKFSRDNENIQLFSNYSLDEVWFVSALFNYQRNLELSLARRFQEMAGFGGKVLMKKELQLLMLSGITINQERDTEGNESGMLFEIPFMVRFNFYRFRHPDLQISSTQTLYYGLTEKGRVRYDSNNIFSLTIVHDLAANLTIYTNYDSKPSANSNSNFDFGTSFSLSYRF